MLPRTCVPVLSKRIVKSTGSPQAGRLRRRDFDHAQFGLAEIFDHERRLSASIPCDDLCRLVVDDDLHRLIGGPRNRRLHGCGQPSLFVVGELAGSQHGEILVRQEGVLECRDDLCCATEPRLLGACGTGRPPSGPPARSACTRCRLEAGISVSSLRAIRIGCVDAKHRLSLLVAGNAGYGAARRQSRAHRR